ncbi:MAG: DUF2807 domain-containing protein [Candidatus Altiarchaeota archaeon]
MLYLNLGLGCVRGTGRVITETRQVQAFGSVAVDGLVTVHLAEAQTPSVVVSAEDSVAGMVVTRTESGILRIGLKDTCVVGRIEPVVVRVSAPRFSSVSAGNLARVVSESAIDAYELTLTASKDARIDATVDAVWLKTLASDGGVISIGGNAQRHEAFSTSRGQILAYGLAANETTATGENFGIIQAYSIGALSAKADSTGALYYMGPGTVTMQNTEGGTIERAG